MQRLRAAVATPLTIWASMTILDKIMATKRQEIAAAKQRVSLNELESQAAAAPPTRDFFAALADPGSIKLIAEVKKASPSAGLIRDDFEPVDIAKIYELHGATCISVLTDELYFQGHLDYLQRIRASVNLPILRKDFIVDRYQLVEARAAGADAVLLIAECLAPAELADLVSESLSLKLTPLVELYDPANLPVVLASGAKLIGVNNRNLHTFEVDLGNTLKLRELVPRDCVLVGESGIRNHDDVVRLEQAGVNAILVGESLMREHDIGAAVDRLLRGER